MTARRARLIDYRLGPTMKALVSGLAFLAAVSGVVVLADEKPEPWESVRVVGDSGMVEGCKRIGEVKGKSSWGGALQSYAESKAYRHIKENALKMGADTVLVVTGHSSWGGSKYRGEAYLCGTPEPTPTPAPAPDPTPVPPPQRG